MTNENEIQKRLNIIKALEGPKLRITYDLESFTLRTDSCLAEMDKDLVKIHEDRRYNAAREFTGELATAVDEINAFIKEKLSPFIEEQKTKIKELL